MSNQNIVTTVNEILELRRMKDEIEAELSGLEDSIKNHMTSIGAEEIMADNLKVRYKTVTSSRIDTTNLKKELPEIAARFNKVTESKRFSISA